MSPERISAWLWAALWAAWSFAARGFVADTLGAGPWMPDLGLALLVVLGARLPREDLPWLGLLFGTARCAVSIDPPVANLAVALGVVALTRALHGVVDVQRPLTRALLAFVCALGSEAWLALAHFARLRDEAARALLDGPTLATPDLAAAAGKGALATALCVLVLGEALVRLPGLSALWRSRPWQVGASSR